MISYRESVEEKLSENLVVSDHQLTPEEKLAISSMPYVKVISCHDTDGNLHWFYTHESNLNNAVEFLDSTREYSTVTPNPKIKPSRFGLEI